MIDAIVKVIDRIISLVERADTRNRAFYEEQIAPLFADLQTIHADYAKIFERVRQAVEKPESDINQLISDVRKARLDKLPQRQALKDLALALHKSDHAESVDHPLTREQARRDLTEQFAISLLRYFRVAIYGEQEMEFSTQLTALLEILNDLEKSRREDWSESRREYHLLKARLKMDELVQTMNAVFCTASAVYSELKLLCQRYT